MTPIYGWGPTHERVVEPVPHGHWMTITFVGALRSTGLFAPLVVDGAMNGELFVAYVRQHLVRTLKPGDIVVMDNLPSHKVAGVAEAIRGVGAELVYLPPYSPGSQPDRAGVREGQDGDPQTEAADGRRHRDALRRRLGLVLDRRMSKLHPTRRIWTTTIRLKML